MPAHIMLSYQWDSQDLVEKVYNYQATASRCASSLWWRRSALMLVTPWLVKILREMADQEEA